MPELHPTASIKYLVHVTPHMTNYDLILGRDILQQLGIVLDFKESQIRWNEYYTPMNRSESNSLNNYTAEDVHAVQTETERI